MIGGSIILFTAVYLSVLASIKYEIDIPFSCNVVESELDLEVVELLENQNFYEQVIGPLSL